MTKMTSTAIEVEKVVNKVEKAKCLVTWYVSLGMCTNDAAFGLNFTKCDALCFGCCQAQRG